jgi:hypothetical protein
MTGFIASSIVWDEILVDAFAEGVSGIDCVLHSDGQVFSYTVSHGITYLR